jgi:hypothetical protein
MGLSGETYSTHMGLSGETYPNPHWTQWRNIPTNYQNLAGLALNNHDKIII